jgi:tRNA C32,U32 (ribose-2'-O)-methylase TrmJ
MRNLKHLIERSGLTRWELRMLHGLCTQVEKRIKSDIDEIHKIKIDVKEFNAS